MKTKKLLALVMAAVLTAGILAGCGGDSGSGDNSKKYEAALKITEADGVSGDILSIKQPSRELDTKELNVYTWLDEENIYTGNADKPNSFDILKDQYGVKINVNTVSQTDYWKNLSTLIAGGSAPDVVLIPNWNYYPTAITNGCLQPLDGIINFDKPLWEGGKELREKYKWTDGKNYFAFYNSGTIQKYIFFNKKIFSDMGLKNPYEYYKEGNWTYETFKELCSKTFIKEGDTVTQYAIYMQPNYFINSTGVEVVEVDKENGYKLNLRDEKIAKCMNLLGELGNGGLAVIGGQPSDFRQQRMAMILTDYWCASSEFKKIREAGNLGRVPLPAVDKASSCYNVISVSTGYGLVKGAKNVNCAALLMELDAWTNLSPDASGMPATASYETPYYKTYTKAEEIEKSSAGVTSDEDKALMKEIGLENVPGVSFMWASWLQGIDSLGQLEVTDYAQPWSQVLEQLYPKCEKVLKAYFED